MSHLVRSTAQSSAPIETVWKLLSTVETWPTWSRHKLARLERDGSPTPDGLGAIRVLATNPAKPQRCNREEVIVFDPPGHFAYKLLSGQPLKDYRADVRLATRPDGGTSIVWESKFENGGAQGLVWVLAIRWVVKHWSADLAKGADAARAS